MTNVTQLRTRRSGNQNKPKKNIFKPLVCYIGNVKERNRQSVIYLFSCAFFCLHKIHFMKYVLFEEAFLCHFCMSSRVFVCLCGLPTFGTTRSFCFALLVHSLSMWTAKMNVLLILGTCLVNSYEFECNLITPKIDPHNKLSFLSDKWTNFYLRINRWSMKLSSDSVAVK